MELLQVRHKHYGLFQTAQEEETEIGPQVLLYWTDVSNAWFMGICEFDQHTAMQFIEKLTEKGTAYMADLLSLELYDFELNKKLQSVIWIGRA